MNTFRVLLVILFNTVVVVAICWFVWCILKPFILKMIQRYKYRKIVYSMVEDGIMNKKEASKVIQRLKTDRIDILSESYSYSINGLYEYIEQMSGVLHKNKKTFAKMFGIEDKINKMSNQWKDDISEVMYILAKYDATNIMISDDELDTLYYRLESAINIFEKYIDSDKFKFLRLYDNDISSEESKLIIETSGKLTMHHNRIKRHPFNTTEALKHELDIAGFHLFKVKVEEFRNDASVMKKLKEMIKDIENVEVEVIRIKPELVKGEEPDDEDDDDFYDDVEYGDIRKEVDIDLTEFFDRVGNDVSIEKVIETMLELVEEKYKDKFDKDLEDEEEKDKK